MGNTTSSDGLESFGLALDKEEYFAGDSVRGYVEAVVTKPIACSGVFVELGCNCHTRVGSRDENAQKKQDHELLGRWKLQVAKSSGNSTIKAGTYQFRFAFLLPEDAPPSILFDRERHCFASVVYFLNVRFAIPKKKNPDVERQYLFRVYSSPKVIRPLIASTTAQTKSIFSCFGCGGGSLFLKLEVEKDAYEPSEIITVSFEIRNNSNSPVRKVEMYVKEYFHIRARGKVVRAAQRGKAGGSKISCKPGESIAGALAMPFGTFSSSIESPTLVVEHRLIFKVFTEKINKKTPKIKVPIIVYGQTNLSNISVHANLLKQRASQALQRSLDRRASLERRISVRTEAEDDFPVQPLPQTQVRPQEEDDERRSVPRAIAYEDVLVAEPIPYAPDAEILLESDPYTVKGAMG